MSFGLLARLVLCLFALSLFGLPAAAEKPRVLLDLKDPGKYAGTNMTRMVLGPHGRYLGAAVSAGPIVVWDLQAKKLVHTIHGGTRTLAFAPSGKLLAAGVPENGVSLWALPGARSKGNLQSMLKSYAMAFSGDGKHLAVAGVRKLGRKRSYDAVEVWRNTGNSWRLEKSLKMNPAVSCIALSRDGRWLALGSRDHKIYLRDLDRKASMKTLSGHKTTIVSLGFSQDGKRLVSGGDEGRVILWDLEKSKQRYDLPQGLVGLRAVAIQPDGHFVAMSDSQVTIWSASTGMQALAYRGGSNARISGLSPDGLRAVFADWNRIQVWSLEVPSAKDRANRLHGILSRTGRYRIEGGSREGSGCIEFSPDSKLLASAERSSIRLIKVATGTLARRLKPGAHILRFSPDGTKLAAGAMGRVRVYRVTDGRLLHTLKGHAKNITGLVFSPDGKRLYSCSTDATRLDTVFQVTDPASGRQLSSYKPLKGRREDLAISPDGKLLFLDANPIQVVRAEDLKPVRTVPGSSPLALSPDGSILAARERHGGMIFQNPAVRLTQVTTGKRIRALVGHSKRVGSLAFSPDGKWLATGYRKTRIWSVADGRQLWLLDNKQDYAAGMLAFSPDGRLLATGGSADIVLWSLEKLRKGTPVIGAIRPREGHLGKIILLRYSGDGRWLLSSGVDRKLRVWDSATGKLHRTLTLENALNSGVAISKDGTKIAATSSGHTTVWDRDSGRQIAAVQGKHGVLAFVGEGKQLLVADPQGQLLVADTQVRIIELSTGRKVRSFEGSHHLGSISTDGRLLVSTTRSRGMKAGRVQLWDARSGRVVRTLVGTPKEDREYEQVFFDPSGSIVLALTDRFTHTVAQVWRVRDGKRIAQIDLGHGDLMIAVSPGGKMLASVHDGQIRLWQLTSGKLVSKLGKTGGFGSAGKILAYNPIRNEIAVGLPSGEIRIWSVDRGKITRTIRAGQ